MRVIQLGQSIADLKMIASLFSTNLILSVAWFCSSHTPDSDISSFLRLPWAWSLPRLRTIRSDGHGGKELGSEVGTDGSSRMLVAGGLDAAELKRTGRREGRVGPKVDFSIGQRRCQILEGVELMGVLAASAR